MKETCKNLPLVDVWRIFRPFDHSWVGTLELPVYQLMVFRTSRYLSLHTQFQLNSSKCTGVRLQNQGAWENRFSPVKSMLQSIINNTLRQATGMPNAMAKARIMGHAVCTTNLNTGRSFTCCNATLVFIVYGTYDDICPAEQRCCIILLCLASKACDGHGSNQRNHNAFLLKVSQGIINMSRLNCFWFPGGLLFNWSHKQSLVAYFFKSVLASTR